MDIEKNKEEFIQIFSSKIKREGSEKLLEYLKKSTFFTDPSAKSHHGNFEGGLCEHSLNVYKMLVKFCKIYEEQFPENDIGGKGFDEESIAIVSLLHDLCKIGLYEKYFRNVKNEETGQWEKKQDYKYNEKLGMGHGEGSVYIVQSFMQLKRDEALAIRWHMSGWDSSVRGGESGINVAKSYTPLVQLISVADGWASQFMEETL